MIEWKTAKNSNDFRKEHFKGFWEPKYKGVMKSLSLLVDPHLVKDFIIK